MKIRLFEESDRPAWDQYVLSHPHSTHCHLVGWKDVIRNAYGHPSYYLIAEENRKIAGVLPLIHIKSLLFGSSLVSMPYLNYGGVLGDSDAIAGDLLDYAMGLMGKIGIHSLDLRQTHPLPETFVSGNQPFSLKNHKIRMVLNLPGSSEEFFNSLKSKLRSQVRRPQKEGMNAVIGGMELVSSFYQVFSTNMRDLGSPVHAKKLFEEICRNFETGARIGLVYHQSLPVAAGLVSRFKDTVEIPWASSLKEYGRLSPNMLLYWSLLENSCQEGYRFFDFGRSTKEEGTYKFKEQWGARPEKLWWYLAGRGGEGYGKTKEESIGMKRASALWQRIPLPIANIIGPVVRKAIPL